MTRIHRKKLTHTPSDHASGQSGPTPSSGGAPVTDNTFIIADKPSASLHPLWHFNDQLCLISHEPNRCEICNSWTLHYVQDSLNNEPSLEGAICDRDQELLEPLLLERDSLIMERDTLLLENERLRAQLANYQAPAQQSNQVRYTSSTQLTTLTEQPPTYQVTPPIIPERSPLSHDLHESTSRLSIAPPSLLARMQTPGQAGPFTYPFPSMRFPALLPIIYCHTDNSLHAADSTVSLTPTGDIDFHAHPRYIFATGNLSDDSGPNFQTTLVKRERFLTPAAIAARRINGRLPLPNVVFGGRNGVLISPDTDPQTQEDVNALFSSPDKVWQARTYAERIRFTPPELRGPVHSAALARWNALPANRGPLRRAEPLPSTTTASWRYWLRQQQRADEAFLYSGIPLVGAGYQSAHIEGNCALLLFIPLNNRGSALRKDFPRKSFLSAAAALLSVPQMYEQLTAAKQIIIAPIRRYDSYSEARFGSARTINTEQLARFLAANGVTQIEAEQWRPWATAYLEMELAVHPENAHAPALRQARDLAHKRIEEDPSFILTSVHTDAPGNYNPVLEQIRATRAAEFPLKRKRDTPLPSPTCGEPKPLTPTVEPVPLPEDLAADAGNAADSMEYEDDAVDIVEYGAGWDDEDMKMGPD
jgi:hypothetical protein